MFKTLFSIRTPVIYDNRFATVVGYDDGFEMVIIEFCDRGFIAVNPSDLIIDQEAMDMDT